MPKVTKFSPSAVAKVFLHATKFPHSSVNGVLLVKEEADAFVVVDAVPFFHDHLALAPMLEVALYQVERYCQTKRLDLVGYYHISDVPGSLVPDLTAQRIGDRFQENNPGAFLMTADFKEFLSNPSNFSKALSIHVSREGKWKPAESGSFELLSLEPEEFCAGLRKLAFDDVHSELCDFDDHLDDITLDWRNSNVTERVSSVF